MCVTTESLILKGSILIRRSILSIIFLKKMQLELKVILKWQHPQPPYCKAREVTASPLTHTMSSIYLNWQQTSVWKVWSHSKKAHKTSEFLVWDVSWGYWGSHVKKKKNLSSKCRKRIFDANKVGEGHVSQSLLVVKYILTSGSKRCIR